MLQKNMFYFRDQMKFRDFLISVAKSLKRNIFAVLNILFKRHQKRSLCLWSLYVDVHMYVQLKFSQQSLNGF